MTAIFNSRIHLSCTGMSDLPKTAFVTLNRMPCSTHTLQLSIRAALEKKSVKNVISTVRDTCKLYRRSTVGADMLERVQRSAGGNVPLRPILDLVTRWSSTLFMIVRFLKIHEHLDTATAWLYREQFEFGKSRASLPLTTAAVEILNSCVSVLEVAEETWAKG